MWLTRTHRALQVTWATTSTLLAAVAALLKAWADANEWLLRNRKE